MLKALGILLVALPFIGIAAISIAMGGVIQTLAAFGAAGAVMGMTFAGLYLIDNH